MSIQLPNGTVREYPRAPRTSKVDNVHGRKIPDPFRPLERINSDRTRKWVHAENRLTRSYLDQLSVRDEFKAALEDVHGTVRRFGDVVGDRIFYTKDVGKEHPVLCSSTLSGRQETQVFDPNLLSKDGHIATDQWKVSPDGQKLAYGVRRNGSDKLEWRIRDLKTGEDFPDRVRNGRFGADDLVWSPDSKGFFYGRYGKPRPFRELTDIVRYQGSFYHHVGTPQSKDRISGSEGLPKAEETQQFKDGDWWTTVADGVFLVKGKRHPKGAVKTEERTLVREGKDTLDKVAVGDGQLFVATLHDGHSKLLRYDMEGKKLGEISLPGYGTVTSMEATEDGRLIYEFSGPTHPPTTYSYQDGTSKPVLKSQVNFDPDDYRTDLMFTKSKDGTKVPVYVTRRKDAPLDGQRPTYLYGYGGFDVNITPTFDWTRVPWLDKGGVYAQACLRGGGEYGDRWHRDGMRMKKQNVFNDFIGAGEGLIKAGLTSPEHLSVGGGSNGGLLAAATSIQRPDLIAAAAPEVGVQDMVRFPLYTGGFHWINEYGEAEKPGLLNNMLKYSPVHNIEDGKAYPAIMVMTGDHDDRVVPSHSYKLAAELQDSQGGDAPVLLRTQKNIGHGFGTPLSMRIEETADRWAFLWDATGTE